MKKIYSRPEADIITLRTSVAVLDESTKSYSFTDSEIGADGEGGDDAAARGYTVWGDD